MGGGQGYRLTRRSADRGGEERRGARRTGIHKQKAFGAGSSVLRSLCGDRRDPHPNLVCMWRLMAHTHQEVMKGSLLRY